MPSDRALHDALTTSFRHAIHYIDEQDTAPVAALASAAMLRQQLDVPLTEEGCDPAKVIDELAAAVQGGLATVTGGRFFGWVNGGSLPAALAADWLTSVWDQNASLYVVAPAASVIEEIAGRWLKEILRLPATASFAFVTGCQMAHITCLAAARHELLHRRGWDVEQDGLSGTPPIRILTSVERHGSALRAVRLLGLGEKHIFALPSDANGQLSAANLRAALEKAPSQPTIVLLQAGDLNIGAFDNFTELIPLAHEFDAWVHIDGAFGLWTASSPRYRHLVEGAAAADSWATDGHKWLNVPYDCGYAFVAHPAAHRAAFSYDAPYIRSTELARNPIDWTPEWSRRARGFSTYAALRQLGRQGIAALMERTCAHAHALAIGLAALPGAELLWGPQINQGLVRFLSPLPHATETQHDEFTDRVVEKIAAAGEALFSNTTWRGKRAMRISVCNWQTSSADVERVVRSVAGVLAAMREAE